VALTWLLIGERMKVNKRKLIVMYMSAAMSFLVLLSGIPYVSATFGVFNSIDTHLISSTSTGGNRMIALGSSDNVAIFGITSSGHAFVSTYQMTPSGDIGSSFTDNWTMDYPSSTYSYVAVCHVYGNVYLVARVVSTSVRLVTFSISVSGIITKSIISGRNFSATSTLGYGMELLSMGYNNKYIISLQGNFAGRSSHAWCWSVSDAGTIGATSDSDLTYGSDSFTNQLFLIDYGTFGSCITNGLPSYTGSLYTFNVSGAGVLTASDAWTFVSPIAGTSDINPFISYVTSNIYSVAYYDAAGPTKNYLKTLRIATTGIITKSFISTYTFSTSSASSYPTSIVYNGTVNHTLLLSYGEVTGCIIKALNISSTGLIYYVSNYGYWATSNQNARAVMIKEPSYYIISFISTSAAGFRLNTFTLDGTEEEGASTETLICGTDVSLYTKVDSLPYSNPSYTRSSLGNDYQVIETYYGITSTTTVYGVALLISAQQYSYSSNIANYFLAVNGVNIGNPECIEQYGREDTYRIFWSCSQSITGGILFEFKNTAPYFTGGPYWLSLPTDTVSVGGWNFGKYSTNLYNGFYDGNDLVLGVSTPLEFQMSFWQSSATFENATSTYGDLVTCPKTTYHAGDNIPVYYSISDYTYTNYIQLWHNGTQIISDDFPYSVQSGKFNGILSFVPLHEYYSSPTGNYQLRLVRNSVTKSLFNLTVTSPLDLNFILSVTPNPCRAGETVTILYKYYPSDGEDGFIGYSGFQNSTNFNDFGQKWVLTANTSDNLTFITSINVYSPYITNIYVSMYKAIGSTYVLKKTVCLKVRSFFDNTIGVEYAVKSLKSGESFTQRIYGIQSMYGFTVNVKLNNQIIGDVTGLTVYEVYKIISDAGNYKADLCVETANGSKIITSVNFFVSSVSSGATPPSNTPTALFGDYTYVFGIGIIVMFLLLPMTVSSRLGVELPMIINIGSGALGLSFCVLSGFLPLWTAFLTIIAVFVAGVFVMFGR
jgi:hypothetical protein